MDIFFVDPDHRGSNLGFELFSDVEKILKQRGVQRWIVGAKLHFDISALEWRRQCIIKICFSYHLNKTFFLMFMIIVKELFHFWWFCI